MIGIVAMGSSGFNIAMQYSENKILIATTLAISGGAGVSCMPLFNELIVETTYPAGEATSTGIATWLAGPITGIFIALSTLIPYSNQAKYPDSVCRDGETQDLSWFLSIMNGIFIVYCLFFVYFYRKFNHFIRHIYTVNFTVYSQQ